MKIEIDRFDGNSDYYMWKKRMYANLSVFGLKEVLSEATPVVIPVGETPEARTIRLQEEAARLERCDKAMNLIFCNITDLVARKLDVCTTAASAWSTLDRLYLSNSLPNRIHLQNKFYTFKMSESKTIDDNIDDFLKIIYALSSVNVSVTEEVQAILLLNLRLPQYNSLKETLKYGRQSLTLEEVIQATRSRENDLRDSGESGGFGTSRKGGEALIARGRPEKRESFNKKLNKNRSRSLRQRSLAGIARRKATSRKTATRGKEEWRVKIMVKQP